MKTTLFIGFNMETLLSLCISAPTKEKAVDILADVLLRIEKHDLADPHNNDCGMWVYKWSNVPKYEDEDYDT